MIKKNQKNILLFLKMHFKTNRFVKTNLQKFCNLSLFTSDVKQRDKMALS